MKTANLWRFEWGYVGSERRPFAVPPDADGLLMPSEADARKLANAMNAHNDLLAALRMYLEVLPASRGKPVGAPGSAARSTHDLHAVAEQMALDAIAKAEGAAP